jgi:hypothetical protein
MQTITWTRGISGRFTHVNGYKVTEMVSGGYLVTPCGEDGLPINPKECHRYAQNLATALAMAEEPFCEGCGEPTVWSIAAADCIRRAA